MALTVAHPSMKPKFIPSVANLWIVCFFPLFAAVNGGGKNKY
jgi:hypothetical protein